MHGGPGDRIHSLSAPRPSGRLHRIRFYGFLSHRHRTGTLARCRHLLGTPAPPAPAAAPVRVDYRERYETLTGISLRTCPVCHDGQMLLIEHLSRRDSGFASFDSSLAASSRLSP